MNKKLKYIIYLFSAFLIFLVCYSINYVLRVNNQAEVNNIIGNREFFYTYDKPISNKARYGQIKMRLTDRNLVNFALKNQIFEANAEPIPEEVENTINKTKKQIEGRDLYFLTSKDNPNPAKYIFFIHGGGYVFNIMESHWNLIRNIMSQANVGAIVPDYALAPDNKAKNSIPTLMKMYKEALNYVDGKEIFVIGDSAGGGLSLILGQQCEKYALKTPSQLILLSPFVDISLENPKVKIMDKRSAYLPLEGSLKLQDYWCGDLDNKNPLVSPLYGDMKLLPPVSIFVGGLEIFLPDGLKLADKLKENNKPYRVYYYPMMWHAWQGGYPNMPEDKDAVEQIANLISIGFENK